MTEVQAAELIHVLRVTGVGVAMLAIISFVRTMIGR